MVTYLVNNVKSNVKIWVSFNYSLKLSHKLKGSNESYQSSVEIKMFLL